MDIRKFVIIQAILLLFTCAQAQDGDFFLTHYSPTNSSVDNVNFDIIQDQRGVICIANRAGILTFDGKNWDFTKTPSALFSLDISDDNVIYAGGRSGFGRLSRDASYNLNYVSLSKSEDSAKDIFDVLVNGKKLYAINERHIFIYDIEKGSTEKVSPRYSGKLLHLVSLKDKVYVTTSTSGLQLIHGSKLSTPEIVPLRDLSAKFITSSPDNKAALIGTREGKLYTLKNNQLVVLDSDDNDYLKNSGIKNGIWFSDTLIAVSTLKGGVVFINPANQKISEIINYQTGLPDNEIYAMAVDRKLGVWAAHAVGLTRISPTFPFKNFNRYPGLQGKMLSVKNHNGQLYVGTSLGAYYLDEIRNYNEVVNYVEVTESVSTAYTLTDESRQETVEEKSEKKKGLFGFLKKNKRDDEPSEDVIVEERDTTVITENTFLKRNVERELQSIRYKYKKIEGIDSKTFHFSAVGGRLFCGGLDGLFEIIDNKAIAVSRLPIRYFYISKDQQKIFASTYTDRLKVFDYSGDSFRDIDIFGDYKDHVEYIFEDKSDRIWFCSASDIYWVKMKGDEIMSMDEYHMDNPYYYETFGAVSQDSILFINESGVYTVSQENRELIKIKSAEDVDKYLSGSEGKIWVHSNQAWSTLIKDDNQPKLNLLSLFKNINYVASNDNEEEYWVITDSNDLYKLSLSSENTLANGYDLYLRDIKTSSETIPPSPKLVFDQQNSNLIFEFVQPEYSGVLDIQYSYKLEGLNDTWSEWSSGYNNINFPYLPEGDYNLKVRSRNALGKIIDAEPVSFKVIPPYWKRPWFYALECLMLALLLYVSVRMKKLGNRYRIVSRVLALLTLIIIIEFIQTIAENEFSTLSSPVLDFIIQVIIAIIILPVEGALRKFIFKERNIKVLDFIRVKQNQVKPKVK